MTLTPTKARRLVLLLTSLALPVLLVAGCHKTRSKRFDRIVADFSFVTEGPSPLRIRFVNRSYNKTTGAGPERMLSTWDFGDGTASYDVNPVHTFPKPGTYHVKLVVQEDYWLEINSLQRTVVIPNLESAAQTMEAFELHVEDQEPILVWRKPDVGVTERETEVYLGTDKLVTPVGNLHCEILVYLDSDGNALAHRWSHPHFGLLREEGLRDHYVLRRVWPGHQLR